MQSKASAEMMVSAFITYSPKTFGLESSFLRELKTSCWAEHHFHAFFLLMSSKGLDFLARHERKISLTDSTFL